MTKMMDRDEMLCDTQKYFLSVMTDFIHKRATSEKSVRWNMLLEYAKKHQVLPIIYRQCKEYLKDTEAKHSYYTAISNYVLRENTICLFSEALHGIEHVFLKGVVISKYYPHPELRSMGDVDVLVHLEERDLVHTRLLNAGFSLHYKEANYIGCWHYIKNNITFEVHVCALHEEMSNDIAYCFFTDEIWQHIECGVLNHNVHFLLLVMHIKEHLIVNGVGFRQFMDLAIACKNWNLDWVYLNETSSKIGLNAFLKNVMLFIDKWFSIDAPYEFGCLDDNFYLTATNSIFENGVFGFDNKDNVTNATVKHTIKFGKTGMIKRMFNAIFLPYKNMIMIPEYQFLIDRKYLLPVAWIYRIILKWNKRQEIRSYIVFDSTIANRMEYLEKWGL